MTARIQQLAQPKPNRLQYPDRPSVYWLDKSPPPQRTKLPTESGTAVAYLNIQYVYKMQQLCYYLFYVVFTELTPRWAELCGSQKFYAQLTRSPMWKVSDAALRAVASERLCRLAQPRTPPSAWQPAFLLPIPLRRATQTAVATPRICQLARPKTRPFVGSHVFQLGAPKTPRKASAHIELLASKCTVVHQAIPTPKREHPKHEDGRPVCWPVSRAARTHIASQRLVALSSPKQRKALFEGYDPYTVSQAARSADPSPRIQQLCLPAPHKCSSK
uniref:sperm microtubule associated protein 2 n=1 Tax=Doryrhamphus excisus TaxID=161450 RepID=UPI0025AE76FD|nr:sperm microtubule associated protein 2 [Doryrhamphus excisus]